MRRQTAILLAASGGGLLLLFVFLGVTYFVWNDFQDRQARVARAEYEQEWGRMQAAIDRKISLKQDLEQISSTKPGDRPFNVSGLSKPELQAEISKLSQQIDESVRHLEATRERWGSRWRQLGYER
jgi:hypothetical protein